MEYLIYYIKKLFLTNFQQPGEKNKSKDIQELRKKNLSLNFISERRAEGASAEPKGSAPPWGAKIRQM